MNSTSRHMAQDRRMERLRADLIRRSRLERHGENWEAEDQNHTEMQESHIEDAERSQRPRLSRLAFGRRDGASTPMSKMEEAGLESPKTPASSSRRPTLSSFYMASNGEQSRTSTPSSMSLGNMPSLPEAAVIAGNGVGVGSAAASATHQSTVVVGTTNQESEDSRRGRRRHRRSRQARKRNWMNSSRIRAQMVQCCVSGLFLTMLLAVYLGLAVTNNVAINELNNLMILVVLLAALFFFYTIIRLCIVAVRGGQRADGLPDSMDPRGYAIPRKPIRVVLAQDEESAGSDSEVTRMKPPAYGLWRESVRVDPNRLFWQRNEAADAIPQRPVPGPRPPSYASDDGVSYVVDAVPRSVAPQPLHSADVGGIGQPPQ